MKKLHKIEDNK